MMERQRIPPRRVRGRTTFAMAKPFLLALAAVFRIAPSGLGRAVWSLANLSGGHIGVGLRYAILRGLARECGDNVYVGRNVEVRGWSGLSIGSNVSIHAGCYLDATGSLTIGNEVSIAHQSSFLTFDHTWQDPHFSIRDNPVRNRAVVINDDVWIGCACRILAGVTIGSRSVVAAGAVVTRPVEGGVLVAGVPGRVLRSIGPGDGG